MKANFIFKVLLVTLCIVNQVKFSLGALVVTPSPPVLQQTIWYENYNTGGDYHVLGMKFYDDVADKPTGITYKLKVERKKGDKMTDEVVDTNSDNYNYKYRYFLPEFDGTHKKRKSYVLWDIKHTLSQCYVEYNIKYFDCDATANDFYDNDSSLNNKDKKKLINRVSDESHSHFGNYENSEQLKTVLFDIIECETNIGADCPTENDYLPYPCLVNFESINCVCALDPSSPECTCEMASNCSSMYNDGGRPSK